MFRMCGARSANACVVAFARRRRAPQLLQAVDVHNLALPGASFEPLKSGAPRCRGGGGDAGTPRQANLRPNFNSRGAPSFTLEPGGEGGGGGHRRVAPGARATDGNGDACVAALDLRRGGF